MSGFLVLSIVNKLFYEINILLIYEMHFSIDETVNILQS